MPIMPIGEYIFLLAGLAAGFHAFTFARWLRQNGNQPGAAAVLLLVLLSLAVPIYRIIMAP